MPFYVSLTATVKMCTYFSASYSVQC